MKSPPIHLSAALVVCALALAGYWLWYAVVAEKSAAVIALQNGIDASANVASRAATARAALVDLEGDEALMRSHFVSETGVVAFINGLEALGRATGSTTVSVLSVSTAADSAARPAFKFALLIKGTFDGVMRTVGAIEYLPYAISVSSLSVAKNAKNDWQANLVFLAGSRTP